MFVLAVVATGWIVAGYSEESSAGTPELVATGITVIEPDRSLLASQARPNETGTVIVAAQDLPVGMFFSRTELARLVTHKSILLAHLPSAFIVDVNDFVGKRLTRTVRKGETFHPGDLSKSKILIPPDGPDRVTLPMPGNDQILPFVPVGSLVDVYGAAHQGTKLTAMLLLQKAVVLAVENRQDAVPPTITFAVAQEQALVLGLAKERGCHLQLLLRHPNNPVDSDYDIRKVVTWLHAITPSSEAKGPLREDSAPRFK